MSGSNPTLSATLSFSVFVNLVGHVGSQRAGEGESAPESARKLLKSALVLAPWGVRAPATPTFDPLATPVCYLLRSRKMRTASTVALCARKISSPLYPTCRGIWGERFRLAAKKDAQSHVPRHVCSGTAAGRRCRRGRGDYSGEHPLVFARRCAPTSGL